MNQDADRNPYRQLLLDLQADLSHLAKKHGERFLEQAVRDATKSEVLQEIANDLTRRRSALEKSEDDTTGEQDTDEDVPPEDLDYPDEDVWTVPPAPDEEESKDDGDDEDELSEAAEKVLSDLMDRFTAPREE